MIEKPVLTDRFYRTRTGKEPVRDWLISLSPQDRKLIGIEIKTVQYGWPMGMPLVEKLESHLWEIRCSGLSFGIARIIFTLEEDFIVLLHGFEKKTMRITRQDMELARKRLSELRG